jgi:hypothetical protein
MLLCVVSEEHPHPRWRASPPTGQHPHSLSHCQETQTQLEPSKGLDRADFVVCLCVVSVSGLGECAQHAGQQWVPTHLQRYTIHHTPYFDLCPMSPHSTVPLLLCVVLIRRPPAAAPGLAPRVVVLTHVPHPSSIHLGLLPIHAAASRYTPHNRHTRQ